MNGERQGAFTLVEVLVALLLLSAVTLAVAATLVSAQRACRRSQDRMRALALAAAEMERLRAGAATAGVTGGFAPASRTTAVPVAGLSRVEVTVSWNDGGARSLQLATLLRR